MFAKCFMKGVDGLIAELREQGDGWLLYQGVFGVVVHRLSPYMLNDITYSIIVINACNPFGQSTCLLVGLFLKLRSKIVGRHAWINFDIVIANYFVDSRLFSLSTCF